MVAPGFPSKLKAIVILLLALTALSVASPRLTEAAVPSQQVPVVPTSSDKLAPVIGADKVVVWEDKRDNQSNIYGKNLATGQEFPVASGLNVKSKPVTNGKVVIWEEEVGGNSDLYLYHISSGQLCAIASDPPTGPPSEQRKPVISGNRVMWQDNRSGKWEIRKLELPADMPATCPQDTAGTPLPTGGTGNKTNPAISGNTVVWQDDRGGPGTSDIYAMDLSTGQEIPVSTGASYMNTPAISGSIVVWEDHRNGAANVYGKDLSTGVEFQVTSGSTPTTSPKISGGTVVWESQYQGAINYGNHDVLGTSLDVAPGAPSGVTATGATTGVNLSWSANLEGDVVGYNVYRSGSADGNFEKLNASGTLGTTSYSDASAPRGEASFYKVTAVDGAGNESAPSTAMGAAAQAQTGVTLEASLPRLNLGEAATLSGKLMRGDVPLSGKPVTLEQSPAGLDAFGSVAGGSPTTCSDGSFLLAGVKPQDDTDYRVVYAGDEQAGLLASTSQTKRVDVVMPGSLSLISSPLTVKFGATTTLSGRFTKNGAALAGKRVTLEHRPVGAKLFSSLGARTTSASGDFSFAGVKPTKSTDYRVRFSGDTAAGLQPGASAVRRVNVKVVVSANVSDTSVTAGQRVRISGAVSPVQAGNIKMTIKGNGRVITETSISMSQSQFASTPALIDSNYALTYKPPAPGTYEVQVRFGGDSSHLGNSSVVRTFRVAL